MSQIVVNEPNRWRLDTPGASNWPRSARPDAAKKYFMASADGHANEPANLWVQRIDEKYRERLPRVITDKDGVQWRVSEGHRPDRLRLSTLEGEDQARNKAGADPLGRLADVGERKSLNAGFTDNTHRRFKQPVLRFLAPFLLGPSTELPR